MQIVYLSRRPDVLAGTLRQVQRFMPFINEAVVACPDNVAHKMAALNMLKLTVITDKELLGESDTTLGNHQTRNLALRRKLVGTSLIQETFLMSDDDSRPLREIPKEVFIEDGRYHSYYFYDLSQWPSNVTDFDKGQHNTCAVLTLYGYPHLSYASHMPQIIDRSIFLEAMDSFSVAMKEYSLCEWGLYYNYAHKKHAKRFHESRPFRTLCWPDYPEAWPWYVHPSPVQFENYYPTHYQDGHLLHGLEAYPAPEDAERVALAKMVRWQRVAAGRRALRPDLHDPWHQRWLLKPLFWYWRTRNRMAKLD